MCITTMLKQYIIRKYVIANKVQEALRKEKSIKPDEAWIDTDWKQDKIISVGYKNMAKEEKYHKKEVKKPKKNGKR